MRGGFDRTSTLPLGHSGRRSEAFVTRPSYSLVTMPRQLFCPPVSDGRRRGLLRIVCGTRGGDSGMGLRRRHRGRRLSSSTLCGYITAVVLLQNALMAYNVARRASLVLASEMAAAAANLTLNESTVATANWHPSSSTDFAAALARPSPTVGSAASSLGDLYVDATPKTQRLYYRKRPTKVNPYKHQLLLVPTRLCDADTVMVILVHSGTRNVDRRAAIRDTWGSAAATGRWPKDNMQKNGSCAGLRLAFVLGLQGDEGMNRAVRQEHAHHNDIVQGDFIDDYHNMTLKSLLGLKVVDERCPGVSYLLKTDDDMIVNLPYLLQLLANKRLQRSIMGPVNVGARVHRSGKWKLTQDEFPFSYFPPYESGSAYVITGDLIHELYVSAEYVPHIFVDDVYITGILGRIVGVNHVMQSGFAFWHGKPPSVCDIVMNRVVAGTKMTPATLRATWSQLHNPPCSVSISVTKSLVHDIIGLILSVV